MRALALLFLLAGCTPEPEEEPLIVFAAASMTDVAHRLAELHEQEEGQSVTVSVGATSLLTRQILAGAPADVLLAPGDEWLVRLRQSGRVQSEPFAIATGALAVVIPRDATRWDDFREIAEVDRVALADPTHVPAGQFARVALSRAGLWDAVAPRVIPLPHVRAALAAVASGKADAAVVYASDLAVTDRVQPAIAWPDSLQPEVTFWCLAVTGTGASESFCRRAAEFEYGEGFGRREDGVDVGSRAEERRDHRSEAP